MGETARERERVRKPDSVCVCVGYTREGSARLDTISLGFLPAVSTSYPQNSNELTDETPHLLRT